MAVIVPDLLAAVLETSQPVIYDTPIGLRQLYTDPHTGDEHYLVHYPQGMKAARHHHSAAHTIIVLDGALSADGQILGPGSYCHFPAMTVMHHEPAPGSHCRFVTIFHGPFDVFPSA
jgi:quercetin dioxygenase-like cupin family protein